MKSIIYLKAMLIIAATLFACSETFHDRTGVGSDDSKGNRKKTIEKLSEGGSKIPSDVDKFFFEDGLNRFRERRSIEVQLSFVTNDSNTKLYLQDFARPVLKCGRDRVELKQAVVSLVANPNKCEFKFASVRVKGDLYYPSQDLTAHLGLNHQTQAITNGKRLLILGSIQRQKQNRDHFEILSTLRLDNVAPDLPTGRTTISAALASGEGVIDGDSTTTNQIRFSLKAGSDYRLTLRYNYPGFLTERSQAYYFDYRVENLATTELKIRDVSIPDVFSTGNQAKIFSNSVFLFGGRRFESLEKTGELGTIEFTVGENTKPGIYKTMLYTNTAHNHLFPSSENHQQIYLHPLTIEYRVVAK